MCGVRVMCRARFYDLMKMLRYLTKSMIVYLFWQVLNREHCHIFKDAAVDNQEEKDALNNQLDEECMRVWMMREDVLC